LRNGHVYVDIEAFKKNKIIDIEKWYFDNKRNSHQI